MIGKKILHYKILEELGHGGMGVVYLAEDTKLERKVALKFLPGKIKEISEERERFKIEAKAAASLNHPAIATIYSIEELDDNIFFVMEYIDGKELKNIVTGKENRESLKLNILINYAIQIAEGLEAAHKKGIVHHDIKSQNIMVTKEGKIKIMDFGLAKIVGISKIFQQENIYGTAAYMSPEQASGIQTDRRTDIWSFGIVLYEMLTGELPFKGDYEQAILYSILNEDYVPVSHLQVDIPFELNMILKKLLIKDREKRYQEMNEVIKDLKMIKKEYDFSNKEKINNKNDYSIAVLPFTNMSPDPEQEYFCDGISEEIINSLAQLNNLRVIARTSVFSFKGKNLDVREIGKTLNVNTLLEGSVRKAGDRLRITTQLIRVSDGSHLWSNKYDHVLKDIFAIQEDIAKNVATALQGFLTSQQKEALRRPETIIEAYEYYLKGRQFFHKLMLEEAREMFNNAIRIDSDYALAYAGLADTHSWLYEWIGSKNSDLEAAEKNSLKAISLAPHLAESHTSRGFVLSLAKKYSEAEVEFKEAIRLNPNYFDAYYLYGRSCFASGQIEKSAELFQKASEVRLEDYQSLLLLGQSLEVLGKENANEVIREGLRRAKKQLELDPHDRRALSLGASSFLKIDEPDEGLVWINRALELYPEDSGVLINAACLFAQLGNKEKALDLLEKTFGKGFGKKDWIENDPDYDSLRNEPRFQALLTKLK